MSINEIKQLLKDADEQARKQLLIAYQDDQRAGVQKLIQLYRKKELQLEAEIARMECMKEYEYTYAACEYICGIDEVGRGPLAGPVVAGAVILPKDCDILYINDSKQLSAAKRDELYEEIYEKAISVGIGMADVETIDRINILQATYVAMREAISHLSVTPDLLLNDAVTIPQVSINQVPIVKGDEKSISIAAASIVAKVTRDRLMASYGEIYSDYHFEKNKGYGSAEHIAALKKLGASPIHRQSFLKNIL